MGGGGIIAVAFQEFQDVSPHPVRSRPGISVAQKGKQRAAEAGTRLHLSRKELEQLTLVHFQQRHGLRDLLRDALAHAGGHHRPLPHQQAGQALGSARAPPQLLEEGLEIGVVPDLPRPRLTAVLLLGAVIRPSHPAGVRDVLDLGVVRRDRDVPVGDRIVITRYRVGRAQKIGHFFTPLR